MPFLEFRKRLYRLWDGENLVGSSPEAHIRIPELRDEHQLKISVDTLGSFVWAVGQHPQVALNGRPLEGEPIPIFHGDRLSLNGSTVIFINDGGASTVRLKREDLPNPPVHREPVRQPEPGRPEAAVAVEPTIVEEQPKPQIVAVLRRRDGQSYIIHATGFRIGREKRCDLIIPDRSVSRLHAEITYSRGQYLLRDLGRTATKVNGKRIREPYKLQVGDLIEIGKYQFDFVRRPATAEELAAADEVTPIRSTVPDAPTEASVPKSGSGFFWLLLLATAAYVAYLLLR